MNAAPHAPGFRATIARRLVVIAAAGIFALATRAAEPWSAAQAEAWRNQIRAAWFVPQPLPAAAAETHGTFAIGNDVVVERVSYATQFGLRVPAIVYRPAHTTAKSPALIVVNGHGGDKYSWYAFYTGVIYARGGAVVLTYDPAGEGERNSQRKSGTRTHDKVEPPDELGHRVGGLMMTDIMQAVSYLGARSDVDAQRIAAMGYSMGSFILAITAAVETRLKACVLAGGGNLDGPDGYWDKSKPMCQGRPYRALTFLGDRPAIIYALHASRGPTLVYNGREDTTVSIPPFGEDGFRALQERVTALRGTTLGLFEFGFEPEAGHRPWFVTRPVALWLERQIDFPAWSDLTIRAMPQTHIAEWSRENGVELDKLYAIEHREGGTRALGSGVPALSRAQLSVFSAEEWLRRKDSLVYESWLREARARISAGQH